jgi:hypothetical protein
MTTIQRSIEMGDAEVVIVRTGGGCTVQGYDGDRVLAESESRSGMNIRVVVRVDRFELFRGEWGDRSGASVKTGDDAVEVNTGGSCVVKVPFDVALKVYTGRSATIERVRGPVLVNAGWDVHTTGVGLLQSCNAGGRMDIDCERLAEDNAKFNAGKDIRLRVRDLDDVTVRVNDMGGYWEGAIGEGIDEVRLKSGGVVTLVTDKVVHGQVLGRIEKPES